MSVTFLTGPAGTGKTTRAVAHLKNLLAAQTPPHSILVLVPQLTLAQPYRALLADPDLPAAGQVDILTLNGLALRTIDLFWPLGTTSAGFGRPHAPPVFLDIEQSQYFLQQAIQPLLDHEGIFAANTVPVTISLPRLMSQILDNLNKAALIGLPHTEVSGRLSASLPPEPANRVALEHTQLCANRFREFCLARNLLDFSLRIEVFYRHLWPVAGVRRYLTTRYRHLIVDNIEEDTPFAHTVLRQWLPETDSALLVHDEDAGFRIFLGANWRTAAGLADLAAETSRAGESRVAPPPMLSLGEWLAQILGYPADTPHTANGKSANAEPAPTAGPQLSSQNLPFTFEQRRFYPQMITWVVDKIAALVAGGTPPGQIVVLAPFVSDALRFEFTRQMDACGLAVRSHRPSRPLSQEPAAKTLLTLARLAFPTWNVPPPPTDVAQALAQAIPGLDLVRAGLLAQVVYRPGQLAMNNEQGTNQETGAANLDSYLLPFESIEGLLRERISFEAGNRFDRLRDWLRSAAAGDSPLLDHFFSRLFGELLSQPGFGFHGDAEAGQVTAHLIESARQFRRVVGQVPRRPAGDDLPTVAEVNRAWLETIAAGIAAAQYTRGWDGAPDADSAVLITPATTFLMSNRPVQVQFWLDAGSSGWWERIAQPLTHPYLLAADWPPGRLWTDNDEVAAQHDRLARLLLGLTRRCREHIYIVNTEFGEQGHEQRGQLLQILQRLLRRLQKKEDRE